MNESGVPQPSPIHEPSWLPVLYVDDQRENPSLFEL
jgi:hypothetical protein